MRILALVTDGFGSYGGIGQYNRDLTTALASMDGVEGVHVLPRTGDRGEQPPPAEKIAQERATKNRWRYSIRAWTLLRRERPDVIFCGHLYMAPLAYALARHARSPLWLQLHGVEAWQMRSPAIRYAAERADLITAVSRYTRRRFLEWADVPEEKVKVLPNTCDAAVPTAESKAAIKQRYGLEGRSVLLTVSRLDAGDRYKGHEKVLRALADLTRAFPQIMYLIVGDGNDRLRLEKVVEERSLTPFVRFTGRVSGNELDAYYRMADVFVMPSSKEGFGIVFLEAASFGLLTIAGNRDGSVDALADGRIGTLVDPEDLPQLVHAIGKALSAPCDAVDEARRFSRDRFGKHLNAVLRNAGFMSRQTAA